VRQVFFKRKRAGVAHSFLSPARQTVFQQEKRSARSQGQFQASPSRATRKWILKNLFIP
jgi:hypothetical protein